MIRKVRSAVMVLALALGLAAAPLAFGAPAVHAAGTGSKAAACEGIGLSGTTCGSNADNRIAKLVNTVVDILSWIVGIAAVIMVIISGFKYITSGGDTSSVASAKGTLIYAIVGLVIVALAQLIVTFVLRRV